MIKELTKCGLETLEVQDGEILKKGMRLLQEKNKELETEYKKMATQYEDMVLKDLDNVYRYENTRLQKTLQVVHEKSLKAEEAYQEAMKLYQTVRSTAPTSSQAADEEKEALQRRIKELEQQNEALSERISQSASTTTTGHVGSSLVP